MTLPVIVVGGFLGAGKTTLLAHWLRGAGGRRLAVLVNDFGELAIDAALVRAAGADAIELTNGCVCCSIGDELGAALDRVAATASAFDAVVVESSGVADPWRIAQYPLADRRFALQSVVVLVDAAALPAQAADPLLADTLERGVAHADVLLLNKVDLASDADRAAARDWSARHAPRSPVVEVAQAAWPLAALADVGHEAKGGWPTSMVDHGARYESWGVAPDGEYDADALRAWAAEAGGEGSGVVRIKGLLPTGGGRWVVLQLAGRRATLRPASPPPRGAMIVAIGLRGQWQPDALARALRHCRSTTPRAARRHESPT